SERVTVSPPATKNCGSHVTNPKISVLTVISTQLPTTMRLSKSPCSSDARVNCGVGTGAAGGGSGPAAEASFSIAASIASASASRSLISSQRGDSGNDLRRYQTISAPTPAITNIGRQPKLGMIRLPSSVVTGRPETTRNAMKASQRPRETGGTNSVRVE